MGNRLLEHIFMLFFISLLSLKAFGAPSTFDVIFPTRISRQPIAPSSLPRTWYPMHQSDTNGNASLGTPQAPKLPSYIDASGNGSSDAASPWDGRTADRTNPYQDPPNTGVTRSYYFVVERGVKAPDGVERNVMLVNGQFPGPTIEANWGDTIEVTVENRITNPEEGTALHWHGLLQKGTPYEDGIPGMSQHPIAPGETFTYSFLADLYGTSWWHAHYSSQYSDGLLGPLIIYGPSNADYDVDLGPVILSDTYFRDYFDVLEDVMGTDLTKVAPRSDNNLINGKGVYDCSNTNFKCTPNAGFATFQFTSGKAYRLRLINAGSEGLQHFSIDNHEMSVIAYDFVPIQPYLTNTVVLGIAQRADVVVKATGSPKDAAWMRSVITNCSLANQPNAFATVYYEDADTSVKPSSTAWPDELDICANDDLSKTIPYYPIEPPTVPATTVELDVNFTVNGTGHLVWMVNNSTFRADYNDPVLFRAQRGDTAFPAERNVYDFGTNSSIRVVLNNLSPVGHPVHLHGHNMFILSEGLGAWNGDIVNPSNPTRRDVQMVRPKGYLVIEFEADNPGVWPLHCHIAWHLSSGFFVSVFENPPEVTKQITPQQVLDLGTTWNQFTSQQAPDQIDSGV